MSEFINHVGEIAGFGDPELAERYRSLLPGQPITIEAGQRARLITAALSETPYHLGDLFEAEDGTWTFQDAVGGRVEFSHNTDPAIEAVFPEGTWVSRLPDGKTMDYSYRAFEFFGRQATATPGLKDQSVSGLHFSVGMTKAGQLLVKDLGSTNGTAVCIVEGDAAFKESLDHRVVAFPDGAIGTIQSQLDAILNAERAEVMALLGGALKLVLK